jgi:ABC-type branched-subunit amino acid transport system substrate-binding protein
MGIIREDNLLGDEYALWLRSHARTRGLPITADVMVGSFISAADGEQAIAQVQQSGAEAYCYVGFGATAGAILTAAKRAAANGYDVPRITMSIFMGTIPGLVKEGKTGYGGLIDNFEGWTGVDQYDERKPEFTSLLDRFAARFGGRRPVHCYTAQGFDMGNLVAHGLALAKPASREGLRRGLERVRRVPATVGGPGTLMSLGPWDHRAYKGDYIVMREIRGGRNVLAPTSKG